MNIPKFVSDSLKFLDDECKKICDITDALDNSPTEKKIKIAEYKCCKYRYASISNIRSSLWHNYRCGKLFNLEYSHHLLMPFDEMLKKNEKYLNICKSATVDEQQEYFLYYSMKALSEQEILGLKAKIQSSDDWESTMLKEKIKGFYIAVSCLDQAWKNRKEVVF